jgi:hypothetical protein
MCATFLAWHPTCVTQVFEKSDRSTIQQGCSKKNALKLDGLHQLYNLLIYFGSALQNMMAAFHPRLR